MYYTDTWGMEMAILIMFGIAKITSLYMGNVGNKNETSGHTLAFLIYDIFCGYNVSLDVT